MKRSLSTTSSPASKKRCQLTVGQKKEICSHKKKHPKLSQNELVGHFNTLWGVSIGRSTISEVLKESAKWMASDDDASNQRQRSGKYQELESALFLWFQKIRGRKIPVSDAMLIDKAKDFAKDIKVDDSFTFSTRWVRRFKERNGIALHKTEGKNKLITCSSRSNSDLNFLFSSLGEAASADLNAVNDGRKKFAEMLLEWDLDLVYNMDETGLFYRLEPDSTLATGPVKGKKKNKERITVALCANATGTHKLKPLVIGRSKRPRCFGSSYNPGIYVDYKNNTKAWMTGAVFAEWLEAFNREMKLKKKKALLILDNASSHTPGLNLSNVTLQFLPPNTTSHIQPMDAGIIRNFKLYYRKHHVRHLVRCVDEEKECVINIREAIAYISDAWNSVKPQTIANCWRHTGLVPGEAEESQTEDFTTEIAALTAQLPIEHPMSVSEFVAVDASEPTAEELSDNEIIALATNAPEATSDDESDDETPPPPISLKQCQTALDQALQFLEENADIGEHHLPHIRALIKDVDSKRMAAKKQSTVLNFFKPA